MKSRSSPEKERIVEVLIPIMIPLQGGAAKKLGGGPEDVFGFLYWMMNHPAQPRPKPKMLLKKRTKRLLRMLLALDAARALQLARAQEGIFMSA